MNISWNQMRIALAVLGALALAMLLNRYIVTDKKRIERTVQEMADAAGKGDIDLLFSHISADCGSEDMPRTRLRDPGGAVPRRRLRARENPMDGREHLRRAGPGASEHFGQRAAGTPPGRAARNGRPNSGKRRTAPGG